jgi:hypothetical protein
VLLFRLTLSPAVLLLNLNELLYLFKEIIDPTAGVIISVLVFFFGRLLLVYRLF